MAASSSEPNYTPPTPDEIRRIKDETERRSLYEKRKRWEHDEIMRFGYEEMKRACTFEDMREPLQYLARHWIVPDKWRLPDDSPAGVFVREHLYLYGFLSGIEDPFDSVTPLYSESIFKEGDWDGVMQYDDDWSHARRSDNPAMDRGIMRYYEAVAKEFDEFWQSFVLQETPTLHESHCITPD